VWTIFLTQSFFPLPFKSVNINVEVLRKFKKNLTKRGWAENLTVVGGPLHNTCPTSWF